MIGYLYREIFCHGTYDVCPICVTLISILIGAVLAGIVIATLGVTGVIG